MPGSGVSYIGRFADATLQTIPEQLCAKPLRIASGISNFKKMTGRSPNQRCLGCFRCATQKNQAVFRFRRMNNSASGSKASEAGSGTAK